MSTVLSVKSKGGFDNFLKITSTLKRRRFNVDRIEMESAGKEGLFLEITLNGDEKEVHQAMRFMRKIEDVYDITQK